MDETLEMWRELTEAPGVPGNEKAVRSLMQRYLEPMGELLTDNIGSIVCRKVGQAEQPKVLIAGHLDEIGFMVTRITDEGFLKFQTLGGWLSQVMLAHRVNIYTRNGPLLGVIGAKPPHLLSPEERKKLVEIKEMYIDIGASSKDEAESWGVRPGDQIVPASSFTQMRNEQLLLAKAWDNRVGCIAVIEMLKRLQDESHPNTVYGAATVQEEVGLRGARTTANLVEPDVSIALDTAIAGDTPGIAPDEASSKLGKGPVLLVFDASMVPHTELRDLVADVAAEEKIPLQFDKMDKGGTDAGAFHISGRGVPSVVLGVPTRYIHSHNAILHREDINQTAALLAAVCKRLDADTVNRLKS
jgi:endoglucanase